MSGLGGAPLPCARDHSAGPVARSEASLSCTTSPAWRCSGEAVSAPARLCARAVTSAVERGEARRGARGPPLALSSSPRKRTIRANLRASRCVSLLGGKDNRNDATTLARVREPTRRPAQGRGAQAQGCAGRREASSARGVRAQEAGARDAAHRGELSEPAAGRGARDLPATRRAPGGRALRGRALVAAIESCARRLRGRQLARAGAQAGRLLRAARESVGGADGADLHARECEEARLVARARAGPLLVGERVRRVVGLRCAIKRGADVAVERRVAEARALLGDGGAEESGRVVGGVLEGGEEEGPGAPENSAPTAQGPRSTPRAARAPRARTGRRRRWSPSPRPGRRCLRRRRRTPPRGRARRRA